MKNYLSKIFRGLAFALLIATSLVATQTFTFAMTEKEDALSTTNAAQYAAVSRPFANNIQTIDSTSSELDEINSILKATSRKIALLEAGADPETDAQIRANRASAKDIELAKQVTQADYEDDIRTQTLESITSKQNIAAEYKKAKQIVTNPGTPAMFAYEAPIV